MKKLFLGVLAIAGLVACVQEDVLGTQNLQNEIGFSGYVGKQVRSDADPSMTLNDLDHFHVWAYVASSVGNVLENEVVSKSGDAWTYTNIQYWVKGHTYRFFALANADENVTIKDLDDNKLTLNNDPYDNGIGKISFTNNEGTQDVLYSSYEVFTNEGHSETVAFNFDHILSKVKFTFKNGFATNNINLVVTAIEMTAPKTATTTLAFSDPAQGYVWADHTGTTTLAFGNAAGAARIAANANGVSDKARLTIPAGADKEYTVTFKVEQYVGDVNLNAGAPVELTSTIKGVTFEAGKAYNFVATVTPESLDLKEIVFAEPTIEDWDREEVEAPIGYYVDGNNYIAASTLGLDAIAEGINNGTIADDITITLNGDIDLNGTRTTSNFAPIGTEEKPFKGTFDGKGHTIKNLSITVSEGKEGKAFLGFFGYAKDATIKNITFENANVNIACLDIDHSQGHIGVVAGSLEGTSLVENVTVKGDIFVEATTTANGASRVAVVAGGNSYGNVTMKNVHVVANEGSYLKANNNVGALAGQLQGKSVFENCSSNIDVTGTKFFAGGIIGLAAGNQLFVNCHTTSDVTLTAGRAGKAHDHYRVGGIAGGWADNKSTPCVVTNCSYTGNLSGTNADGSVAEKFDYMGYVGRGYTLNNCQGSEVIVDGIGFVQAGNTAAEAGVYNIKVHTAAALKTIATKVNGGEYYAGETILLGADIDLNNQEWTPIGSAYADHGFMGNFDGNGFAIKNLNISTLAPDADGFVYAGLFGVTEGVDANNQNYIKNLVIENVTINTTGDIVAAAVAYPYYTVIENVTVKGDISIKGGNYTSGVLAYTRRCVDAKNIAIEANEGSVIDGNMTVGGVISDIQMNGGLKANYSNFSASGLTIKAVKNVGGISGIICGQTLDGANVENVTIDCNDARKGIVAGALGEVSTIKNISYSNVTGADKVVGATYESASEVVNNGDVYSKKE